MGCVQLYIVKNLDYYPAWQFSLIMGDTTAVTMDTGMYIFCTSADAHMHFCLSIKLVDQGVVYPFDIRHIRLSDLPLEPTCPRIIEVLLYMYLSGNHCCTNVLIFYLSVFLCAM